MSKRARFSRWDIIDVGDIVENSATDTDVTLCVGTELSFHQFNQIGLSCGLRIGVDVIMHGRLHIFTYDSSTYEKRIAQRNARLSAEEEITMDKVVNLINFVNKVIPTLSAPTRVTVNEVKFLKFKCGMVLDEEVLIIQSESKGEVYLSGSCSNVVLLIEIF